MELFDALLNRRTIRKFKPDMPSKEEIEQILDAARMAPSAHNKQMWQFIVITNQHYKDQLSLVVASAYDKIISLTDDEEEIKKIKYSKGYATFFNRAPVVIAVLMDPFQNTVETLLRRKNYLETEIKRIRPAPDLQSIGAAVENLSLAAYGLGYGTCWMTAPIVAYEEIEEILSVDDSNQVVAMVCLGKSDNGHSELALKNKKSLEDIVTYID
ncbi:MAG: nitroreductase family protein [Vampirovibrionia bacterium]